MKKSKTLQAKIDFADFCIEYNISPDVLASLIMMIKERIDITCKMSNQKYQKQIAKLNKKDDELIEAIKFFGFKKDWKFAFDQSIPTITDRNGRNVALPM